MPFYISKAFAKTLFSCAVNNSAIPTMYVGLRTDFPTASDTMTAVQEIGTVTAAGYARWSVPPAKASNDTVAFFNSKEFVFTGAPSPNAATHWFLSDSPGGSGTLLASGPMCAGNVTQFLTVFSADGPANDLFEPFVTNGFGGASLTRAATAGQNTLSTGTYPASTADSFHAGEYISVAPPGGSPGEMLEIQSDNSSSSGNVLTLVSPLANSYPVNSYVQAQTTRRVYVPQFAEGITFVFQIVSQVPGTNNYNIRFECGAKLPPPDVGPPVSPPPPPPAPARLFGALEIDRVRQWQHVGAGKGVVQTNYMDRTPAFTGQPISGVDTWVRLRADPRGASLVMLGVAGYSSGSGTFTVFRSTDGGQTAVKAGSTVASSSLIELLSERGLVVWLTAAPPASDATKPPLVSTAFGTYQSDGTLAFAAPAPAMLTSTGKQLTGTLLDMDYDPRSDTLFLLTDSATLRSKDAGLTWAT